MAATIFDLLAGQFGQRLIHTLLERLVQCAHHPLQLQLPEPALGDGPHELDAIQLWPVGHIPEHVDLLHADHLRSYSRPVDLAVVQQHSHGPIYHLGAQALHELTELLAIVGRARLLEQDEPRLG